MTKFSEIKKQLDDLETAIDTSWGAGTAVKDLTDQESKLDAASTAIKALEGTWESDYNAEVAKYNEATYNDFNTKYAALKGTYSKAVSLITKISQTSYAADFVKDLQEVTGENGIYSYAEKIRTLVKRLDEKDWVFTYIGANQDAILEARKIGINNAMNYDADESGTREMWEKEKRSRTFFMKKARVGTMKSRLKSDYFINEENDIRNDK